MHIQTSWQRSLCCQLYHLEPHILPHSLSRNQCFFGCYMKVLHTLFKKIQRSFLPVIPFLGLVPLLLDLWKSLSVAALYFPIPAMDLRAETRLLQSPPSTWCWVTTSRMSALPTANAAPLTWRHSPKWIVWAASLPCLYAHGTRTSSKVSSGFSLRTAQDLPVMAELSGKAWGMMVPEWHCPAEVRWASELFFLQGGNP